MRPGGMENARNERIGDSVLALVLCGLLAVPAVTLIARRDWQLRDDTPRPPIFRRLRLDPNVAPVALLRSTPSGVGRMAQSWVTIPTVSD